MFRTSLGYKFNLHFDKFSNITSNNYKKVIINEANLETPEEKDIKLMKESDKEKDVKPMKESDKQKDIETSQKKDVKPMEESDKEKDVKTIPKSIHLTYMSRDRVPKKVFETLKKYAGDYEIIFYSDDDCKEFLKKNYGDSYVNKFDEIKLGAHKADFFRYCLLYIKGGVYMDIKLVLQTELNTIIDHKTDNLLYSCLSINKRTMFQAIIASYPKNDFFLHIINDFFIINQNNKVEYIIYTRRFYHFLYIQTKKHLVPGINEYNDKKVILFIEKNVKMNRNEKGDKYNGYHKIFTSDNKYIIKSRYDDFPW